jgi:hypothetical protein
MPSNPSPKALAERVHHVTGPAYEGDPTTTDWDKVTCITCLRQRYLTLERENERLKLAKDPLFRCRKCEEYMDENSRLRGALEGIAGCDSAGCACGAKARAARAALDGEEG